ARRCKSFAADAAELPKNSYIAEREGSDAGGIHFCRADGAAEAGGRRDAELCARVEAVDVCGWIGFGVARALRLCEHIGKVRPFGLHGIEDQVRGAVDDAED